MRTAKFKCTGDQVIVVPPTQVYLFKKKVATGKIAAMLGLIGSNPQQGPYQLEMTLEEAQEELDMALIQNGWPRQKDYSRDNMPFTEIGPVVALEEED